MTPAPTPRRHRKRTPLWKTRWGRVAFVCSILFSVCLTIYMPSPQRHAAQVPQAQGQVALPAEGASNRSESMGTLGQTGQIPVVRPGAVPDGSAGQARHGGQATDSAREAQTPQVRRPMRKQPQTVSEKLWYRARIFARLFLFVALGALLGGVIEGRCWYMALARTLGRITHAARLPAIVGIAMPTALASGPAADSMLVSSHREGEITDSALIAGGMANSFLAHMSHSFRALYPVVAAIGLPGLLYFTLQLSGGLLVIIVVLLWNRFYVMRQEKGPVGEMTFDAPEGAVRPKVLSWPDTLRKGGARAFDLVFRLACISVPLLLGMEWLIRAGALDFWEGAVPAAVHHYFPDELLTIVAAQMGGLVQSSAVAANLEAQGLITGPQILLAMLTASAISNPFRALRRNLPTALAIFPLRIAFVVVLGMQFSRLLVTVTAICLVIWWMSIYGV